LRLITSQSSPLSLLRGYVCIDFNGMTQIFEHFPLDIVPIFPPENFVLSNVEGKL